MEENKKIDFEASLKQLEEIVNKIENQTLPLDESIALYEQGKTIIDQLEQALKEAEEKINKLAKSHKRPNRPYGGYLCSSCARKHFKNEARK